MAARPQGVQSYINNSITDELIKTGPGKLYSVNLSWSALAVGDRVIIHDNTAASGTKVFEFLIPTTAGSFAAVLPTVGKEVFTGLFLNSNVLGSGKLVVEIGFD